MLEASPHREYNEGLHELEAQKSKVQPLIPLLFWVQLFLKPEKDEEQWGLVESNKHSICWQH